MWLLWCCPCHRSKYPQTDGVTCLQVKAVFEHFSQCHNENDIRDLAKSLCTVQVLCGESVVSFAQVIDLVASKCEQRDSVLQLLKRHSGATMAFACVYVPEWLKVYTISPLRGLDRDPRAVLNDDVIIDVGPVIL